MTLEELKLVERLEPGLETAPISLAVSLSCAISMKRIADVISGTEDRYGISDSIRDAIETAIFNATRR